MFYDHTKSFEHNVTYGPYWQDKIPTVPKVPQLAATFLGYKVQSLFGVPACPLTVNARSIKLLDTLGYDIITYKSVRSVEWQGNAFPHWVYVDIRGQLTVTQLAESVVGSAQNFDNSEVSTANSFGIQSIKPEYWQEDVNLAIKQLSKNKVLILSLMCTPQSGEKLAVDAQRLARLAAETKANIFEINLACPNTDGGQGLIYEDIDHSVRLCEAMKKELGDRQLLVKVGYYKNQQQLKQFLAESKGVIAGISTTNTYSMKVENFNGEDAFPGRPTAGVAGGAIRTLSMEQAKNAVQFAKELDLQNFAVIGIGGVTKPEHVDQYLGLGVDAVQSATGAWADPLLVLKWKKLKVSKG